ncbi:TonB-dependent receptor [Caulobacter sp. KR2-114]|uniref:TonB-dependent receptor n=1 Tax=Caulobacter sp. KR2-114 TaxID=3400912 RepID=UPI003C0CF24D
MTLAAQTRLRIFFTSDQVAGLRAARLVGEMTPSAALNQLLSGTGLEAHSPQPGVLVLRRAAPVRAPVSVSQTREAPQAEGAASPVQPIDPVTASVAAEPSPEAPTQLDDVVVIGSHIRGVHESASPVMIIGRDDIDRAGYTSVAGALSALPQSFGGLASEQTFSTHVDQSGTNDSDATGVNLRGLGVGATLVLVNGRRMAGTGSTGDFADVSSIPLAAVERVEVLLDGASALYGSDAVGGVVNIVMRSHYDGAETRASVGGAAGGYATEQVAQTFGKTWSTGHALVAYEYQAHGDLPGNRRAFAGNADLRSLGGSDWRQYYSQPGNVLGLNAAGTAYVPLYAIPGGQNGVGLTAGDLQAAQVNLENQQSLYDLLPSSQRHSIYAVFGQDLGEAVEISGDARYSHRAFRSIGTPSTTTLTITPANPYFLSPTGGGSTLVAYSFADELGGTVTKGAAESMAFSLGANARLPAGWRLDAYGAFAQERGVTNLTNVVDSAFLDEALGNTPDNPATAFKTSTDGFFNPFIGKGSNPASILNFIRSGYEHREDRSQTMSLNIQADGALFSLPGGPVRLAIGGQLRRETLKTGGESLENAATPTPITQRNVGRDVRSLFGELNIPVFGDANAIPGFQRLELSVAGRYENYQAIGSTADPKIGLIWSPLTGVAIKASYGTSFRAPNLPELNDPYRIAPTFLPGPNGSVLSLILIGGNPNLKPETATSWTAGVELTPAALPGLKFGATFFDTNFNNRIAQPALDNITTVLTSPELAPFRTLVNPTTSAADLAEVNALLANPGAIAPTLFPATAYGAIADARWVNTGQLDVQGVDFTAAYSTTIGADRLDLQADVSWLDRYERKVTPLSTPVALAGIAGYPADLRGRATGTWTHGPVAASLSLNFVGPGHDPTGRRVDSWTTADVQLRWQPKAASGPLRGLSLSLTIQNLFDTDPPFYNSPFGIGYDPANATALGRLASLQLTKAW